MRPEEDERERTIGGFRPADRVWVILLFAGGGIALGLLLPLLLRWSADLPWMPFEGPLRLAGSFDDAWMISARPLLGAALGAGLGLWVVVDTPILHLGAEDITVRQHGEVVRVIPRDKVDAVHRRGGKVVIESAAGRVLFSGDVEGGKDAVARAFVEAGYPWEGPRPDEQGRRTRP